MISDDELLTMFSERMNDWFATTSKQRAEYITMYQLRDSHSLQREVYYPEDDNGVLSPQSRAARDMRSYKSPAVVNMAAAYLRSIVGMQINNGKSIEAVSADPAFDGVHDIGNDVMEYILSEGGFKGAKTLALEDSHVRGFGATVTTLDFSYTSFLGGRPNIARKFFVAYDLASRGDDVNRNMSWCAYADPINKSDLKNYLKFNGKDEKNIVGGDVYAAQYMSGLVMDKQHLLDMVHHFYWTDYAQMYDVGNPYVNAANQIREAAAKDPRVFELLGKMSDVLGVDIEAHTWTVDKDNLAEVDAFVENIRKMTGITINKMPRSSRFTKVFYRAEIVGNSVIKKAVSYTQKGHALNFITGFFDELEGYHYGIMRPMAQVQMLLNEAITTFHSYAQRAEIGGTVAITGASDGLEELVDAVRQKLGIVSMPMGASVTPLGTTDAAQAMMGLIELYLRLLPSVGGVSPEIMAQLSTKDMGEGLLQSMIMQMNVSLLHSINGIESYLLNQGHICIDLAHAMAEIGEQRTIRAITPKHEDGDFVRFSKQNMAKEYSMRIVSKPDSEEAATRNFKRLVEGVQMFSEAKRDMFAPVVLENMPIDYSMKQELKQSMQPQQDPQAAQMAQRRENAEVSMMEAQAMQLAAQAQKEQQQSDLAKRDGVTKIEKSVSEIEKNNAQTDKLRAETGGVVHKMVNNAMQPQMRPMSQEKEEPQENYYD